MIVPSIDIMNGNAVQLIGGKEKALDAGSSVPIAKKFRLAGEIAVIDLDAALGTGSNEKSIHELLSIASCRVGGGIRDLETAVHWLDAGASRIILGTKAVPEILRELPKKRVMAALDAMNGEVVVEGWQTKTGQNILTRMQELREYVSGFLVTFVEREGRLGGTAMEQVKELVEAAGSARVTIAGGVTTPEEIAELDQLGADAQVGMALYTNKLHLADAIAAPITTDREDGLFATAVTDEQGVFLGLAWSSKESLREAVDSQRGVYQSRKRGIWRKGESSGATQALLSITPDCDRDVLRFTVRQNPPGFCHLDTYTCFGENQNIASLFRLIQSRIKNAPEGSYTKRLLEDPELLRAKLAEEALELSEAVTKDEVIWEAADVLYFTLVAMARAGASLSEVEQELTKRSLQVTRRPGNAKK